ncbi:flavodoxin family protein [Dyadobacter pollutisoli]|uniref:NAD(P)H-dependent oxidoreductase n=1 Tax=Dyadobacter pollutisoli TaxID=2910158 RepID=A0A9E8SQW8_9BACT|nr:NAD(P)H-dependent oxidoreductase [Dyadobacter pollutisoli]WAC13517.1 NAD(P)H-dependent oxidoreductase [Dyadobacter pollutisoli]
MKAIILLGTLKSEGLSNTETLCDFLTGYLEKEGVTVETVKLVTHNIPPGTYLDMGGQDGWPAIMKKIQAADIMIFATPIWWSNHSSETQKAIERLDEINDQISEGKESLLANKAGGIVVTGDSDGAQHIIGSIGNFFNALGVTLPPYCTLSVLSAAHIKGAKTTRTKLLAEYEKEYAETAQKMAKGLADFAKNAGRMAPDRERVYFHGCENKL